MSRRLANHCCFRSRVASHRAGFTLLEVMLALSLSLILLGAIFTAIDQSWRLTANGRIEMERSQLARALVRKISLDIRSVAFVPPPVDADESGTSSSGSSGTSSSGSSSSSSSSGSSGASSSSASGTSATASGSTSTDASSTTEAPTTKSIGIRGTSQRLELHLTRARRDLNFSANVDGNKVQTRSSDLLVVTYHLNLPGAGTTMNGLIRTEGDRLAVLMVEDKGGLADAASRQQVLAPEVTMLQFRYFDGKAWYVEWDSEVNGRLPRAVEMTLGFGMPPRQGGPMIRVAVSGSVNQFRTVVLVPIADPLPEEFVP